MTAAPKRTESEPGADNAADRHKGNHHIAQCHCGRVQLLLPYLPKAVISCNCSICHRFGALWASYAPEEIVFKKGKKSQKVYRWQNGDISFFHCRVCGCLTHYEVQGDQKKIAVNFRMLSPEVIDSIRIRRFDGAKTWAFLDD